MKTWMRRTLIGTGLVAAGLVAAVAVGLHLAERKLHRVVAVDAAPVPWRTDAAALERGRYLYAARGCADCHGADGRGAVVVDSGSLHVLAPDITPAGAAGRYREVDWVRAVRHGVKPDGRPLLVMPSEEFNRLTDADFAAVVAFVRQLPPGSGRAAEIRLPVPVRLAYAAGAVKDAAEKIDHARPPSAPVPEGPTVAWGRYVAQGCTGCHGAGLEGGRIAGGPPDWPPAARLAAGPGSAMATYPEAASFRAMLKTGRRPDGSAVSKVMPFAALGAMNPVDADALYAYLRSDQSGR